jgi:DNA-binding CsgD family transcriptional regulator
LDAEGLIFGLGALRWVAGKTLLSSEGSCDMPLPLPGTCLSGRELEVLIGLALGEQRAALARRLGIKETTLKTHMTRTRVKLGKQSQHELIESAYAIGLLGPAQYWQLEPPFAALPVAEQQVLEALSTGRSYPRLQLPLAMTVGDIRWQVQKLYGRFGVESRTQLVALGYRYGYLPLPAAAGTPCLRLFGTPLSALDRLLLACLARGRRIPAIARGLGVEAAAVLAHGRIAQTRLGCSGLTGAVAMACRTGLLRLEQPVVSVCLPRAGVLLLDGLAQGLTDAEAAAAAGWPAREAGYAVQQLLQAMQARSRSHAVALGYAGKLLVLRSLPQDKAYLELLAEANMRGRPVAAPSETAW